MNLVRVEDIEMIIRRIPFRYCEGKVFLITGANGFLASYLVDTLMYLNEHFLHKKCTVMAMCRNKERAETRFAEWMLNEQFVLLIQNVEKPMDDVLKVDYVFHAASCSSTGCFMHSPVNILSSNILGTYNLLDFAKRNSVDGFLFFSSGAVYGEVSGGINEIRENNTFSLDFCDVGNCYAEGKRSGEAFCKAFFEQYKVPVKIVRIGHTYGPGIDLNDGHVYSDFVSKIIRGEAIQVKNGGTVRPFCYIADAVVAFFKVIFEGQSGEIYNMVNRDETLSMYELAVKLAEEAFPERKLGVVCANRGDNIPKIYVNTDKLQALGWNAEVGVVEGFKRTVRSIEVEDETT